MSAPTLNIVDGRIIATLTVQDNAAAAATAAANSAENSATSATASANTATTQAGIATTQAGIATTKAGESDTSATDAETQAGIATTQAGEAETQAGIATTQAGNSATSATLSQAWAEGTEPGGTGTKSSREWAEEAESITNIPSIERSNVKTIDPSLTWLGFLTNTASSFTPVANDALTCVETTVQFGNTFFEGTRYKYDGTNWYILSSTFNNFPRHRDFFPKIPSATKLTANQFSDFLQDMILYGPVTSNSITLNRVLKDIDGTSLIQISIETTVVCQRVWSAGDLPTGLSIELIPEINSSGYSAYIAINFDLIPEGNFVNMFAGDGYRLANEVQDETYSTIVYPSLTYLPKTDWRNNVINVSQNRDVKGNTFYAAKGVGLRTLSGNWNNIPSERSFNAIRAWIGTKNEYAPIICRIYYGLIAGTSPKVPNNFTLVKETIIYDAPVNNTKEIIIQLDEVIDIPDGQTYFVAAFFTTENTLVDTMMSTNTELIDGRSGIYYSLTGGESTWDNNWFYNTFPGFITPKFNLMLIPYEGKEKPEQPIITLPSNVYVTVGKQINIYYDGIINGINNGLYGSNYSVSIYSSKGKSYQRMWQYKPVTEDIGTVRAYVLVADKFNKTIATKTFNIVTGAANVPSAVKRILMVGDSLTDPAQQYQSTTPTLQSDLSSLGGTTPVFVGTRGSDPAKNEGRGGWSYETFATDSGSNPFWNAGSLDITNYRTVTLGLGATEYIDIVTIFLGHNDAKSYQRIVTNLKLETSMNYAKSLVDAFLADNPNTKILINLPAMTGNTKNGAANNNDALYDYDSQILSILKFRQALIDTFDNNAYHANVEIGICGLTIDRYYGFTLTTRQIADRIPINEDVHDNWFHPGALGFPMISDGYYPQIVKEL